MRSDSSPTEKIAPTLASWQLLGEHDRAPALSTAHTTQQCRRRSRAMLGGAERRMKVAVAQKTGNSDRPGRGDVQRKDRDDLAGIVAAGKGVELAPVPEPAPPGRRPLPRAEGMPRGLSEADPVVAHILEPHNPLQANGDRVCQLCRLRHPLNDLSERSRRPQRVSAAESQG